MRDEFLRNSSGRTIFVNITQNAFFESWIKIGIVVCILKIKLSIMLTFILSISFVTYWKRS